MKLFYADMIHDCSVTLTDGIYHN